MPTCIIDNIYTHSLNGFSNFTKQYMLAGYENIVQQPEGVTLQKYPQTRLLLILLKEVV